MQFETESSNYEKLLAKLQRGILWSDTVRKPGTAWPSQHAVLYLMDRLETVQKWTIFQKEIKTISPQNIQTLLLSKSSKNSLNTFFNLKLFQFSQIIPFFYNMTILSIISSI